MRIVEGIPRGGASDGSVVVDNDNFFAIIFGGYLETWNAGVIIWR